MLYMALAPNEKIEYNKAGPAGPARFEEGVQGYESRAFRGLGVFTSTPFEVNDDTDSLQLLQRNTQVGEFYRMSTPTLLPEAEDRSMDITIYDEEADRFQHISIEEAINACPIFDQDNFDAVNGVLGLGRIANGLDGAARRRAAVIAAKEGRGGTNDDGTERACPFDVIIVRPFIEHNMMSCIMTVAGRDTGATLFGPADMYARPQPCHLNASCQCTNLLLLLRRQISANTSVKTIEGHYVSSETPTHPLSSILSESSH